MKKRIGRNDPCPCGSGKKFKKCCVQGGVAVIEIITNPEYGETACGIFRYVEETHLEAETRDTYPVRIYSSVLDLIENSNKLKGQLAAATHELLFPEKGDTCFVSGVALSLPEDIMIWHNRDKHYVMWFTVTQAKSYFGPTYYEARFGPIEALPWGSWGTGAEAVSNG